MKIVLALSIVLLGTTLTTKADINHAQVSSVKRLTERVECYNGECSVQDESFNPINTNTVYKRQTGQSTRNQIKLSKKEAKQIKKSMNTEALAMKKQVIYVANAGIRNLYMMSQRDRHSISTLAKMSEPVLSSEIIVSTGQKAMNLAKQTAAVLGKAITESALNAKDVSKSFVGKIKDFVDKQITVIQEKVDSGDVPGAKELLIESSKTVKNIANVGSKKLKEIYIAAEKEVLGLADSGAELVVQMAKNQTENIKDLANNGADLVVANKPEETPTAEQVQKVVENVKKEITTFSKDSAERNKDLVNDGLDKTKQITVNGDQTIQEIAKLIDEIGNDIINGNEDKIEDKKAIIQATVQNTEEANLRELDTLISDLEKKLSAAVDKEKNYIASLENFAIA